MKQPLEQIMMQYLLRVAVFSLAVVVFSSCGQKSAGLQEGAVAPDQQLFETGMQYLDKSQFIKARLAFQTLVNTYPESEHTPASFLSIADSFYKEAGTTNLLQAETQYKDFIIFYPTHEIADDAQMKIAAVNVRLMREPDRDPTYAIKAERELNKFLDLYSDSELAPTAEEFLWEVQENLADGMQGVGDFYFSKDSHLASESRYREVLELYPDYSLLGTTLHRLGQSLERLGRVEEAAVYYSRLVSEYPFSEYEGAARERLILLERPVPQVDPGAAAANQAEASRRIDEGFSVLGPIRGVWQIFTGKEDPYEVARQRAEKRKQQEQAASQQTPVSSGIN